MAKKKTFAHDRVAKHLRDVFGTLVDMSDWEYKPKDQKDTAFLSRSLSALCIQHLAHTDPETAAAAVVDEGEDNGIDAVHYDPTGILYVVQSKWRQSADAGFKIADVQRFTGGLRDLLAPKFEKFGPKLRAKKSMLRRVLWDANTLIIAVTIHTGSQKLTRPASQPIDDWLDGMNEEVKQSELRHLVLTDVWEMLTAGSTAVPIELTIFLRDWGRLKRPFMAYYGRVKASEVALWWKDHGGELCTKNLRHFKQIGSAVNDAIEKTLTMDPKHFWYFNNGITLICESANLAPGGGETRAIGALHCKNVNIVNGAQTYGMIGSKIAITRDPVTEEMDENGDSSWVQVRVITTSDVGEDFERQITRATNFQNAVEAKDFASMDENQHRLALEFVVDDRRYTFKSGDADASGDDGCSLYEATQALGCAASVELAVQVKREIGVIWSNTTAPPYTNLFNKHTNAPMVWNAVQIMRSVDNALHGLRSSIAPRAEYIAIHLNRLILHMVFQDPRLQEYSEHTSNTALLLKYAFVDCQILFPKVAEYLEENHPNDYLAHFAKNMSKCRQLAGSVQWDPPALSTAEVSVDEALVGSGFDESGGLFGK